ncbi:MAG TPA: HAD-IC family P-type ATPase, partial [Telluria sp.]|nr:HAD-IC family P-type ATPase [Telluria sp.]
MNGRAADDGLSTAEAARRLAADGPNALPTAKRRTWLRIIADAAHEPMFVLLFAGGGLYLLLGELSEGVLLFSLVLATLGLSLYQEGKTEKALAALRELSSPRAQVMRDGEARTIDSREVVCGDLCVVREGDRVPADGYLVSANGVEADESLLTGESDAVRKLAASGGAAPEPVRPGGHDLPFLYGGTTLVQGHGLLRVTATGTASAIGRIGAALQEIAPGRTPLQRQVARLVTVFALGGAATSIFLVLYYVANGGGWLDALLAGIALALSLLPEEFAVVLAVFPALGAWRLARTSVLTRRLAAIETLGTTSVLCVDKTGTLTENRMSVAALAAGSLEQQVSEHTDSLPEGLHDLLEYAVLASPQDSADPMDKAVQRLGQRALRSTEHLHPTWNDAQEYGITPALRAVSHAWLRGEGGAAVVAAKGAPEAILDLCHLDPAAQAGVLAQVDRMAAGGLRVLAVARATFPGPPWPEHAHDFAFSLL